MAVEELVSTRGAGDCFVAGAAWRLATASRGEAGSAEVVRAAVRAGLRCAWLNVQGEEAVPPSLRPEDLLEPA